LSTVLLRAEAAKRLRAAARSGEPPRVSWMYSYTSVAGYDETVPLIHAKFVSKN
jgi:hypothetical protein